MKLIFCPLCQDVRRLRLGEKVYCQCGKCSGKYVGSLNAEISSLAIPLGIDNLSLRAALSNRRLDQRESGKWMSVGPYDFSAFIIETNCKTIKVIPGDKQ